MTCEEFEELSGAYALDAVTPAERRSAAEHLANCAQCRGLLQELNKVVALLPLTVPPVEPRAEVWEKIAAALPKGSAASLPPAQVTRRSKRRRMPPRPPALLTASRRRPAWRSAQR